MARARSRLHALVFLLSSCFVPCHPSIHVRFAASLSLGDLHVSATLVFAGAASVGGSPPKAEPWKAETDRSKAHGSTGRVSPYVKEVSIWENYTGGMASLTSNFSFQIIPYPSSSSYFAWTVPHVHGQNLDLLPAFPDPNTIWNGDPCFVAVGFNTCFNPETNARGIDEYSMNYTEKTSPSKNLSSEVLLLPRVTYLASHAAARSLDYSGSFGINTTEFWSHIFSVLQEQQTAVAFSAGYVGNSVEYHNLTESFHHCANSILIVGSVELRLSAPITRGSGRVPRRERFMPPYERRTRRLLSGRHGRRATRTQHAAIRGKVKSKSSWSKQASVAASALVGLICAVAGLVLCCTHSERTLRNTAVTELEDDGEHTITEPELRRGLGPSEFRYSDLATATDNFAEERKIGRGGFGPVYRCYLTDQDRHVAIKALSQQQSAQGLKEFQAEVTIMSQLRHRNIVRLVGWCGRRRGLALVYELMPGGSLDTHLYNPDRHMTWPQRYKIALQLGSALRYLHTDCDQCVVHGDIKPANIMLDASLDAKLGDFGLARLVDHGAEPQTTQVVAGTVGYIDPEFVSSRRPSAESDVYSFGVVLLEIACGRRPTLPRRPDQAASAALLASVRDMYRRNVILEAADRRLDGEFDGMQMERLLVTGLWCAHHDPVQRPSIAQAVGVLRSEDAELPVLATMGGSDEEISALEGQAYGDLSADSSAYLDESTETTYLTTAETAYLLQM